jgi:hypothetical protein
VFYFVVLDREVFYLEVFYLEVFYLEVFYREVLLVAVFQTRNLDRAV